MYFYVVDLNKFRGFGRRAFAKMNPYLIKVKGAKNG